MRTLDRNDIDILKLEYYLRTHRLQNPPTGIIPPDIDEYRQFAHILDVPPQYDIANDYAGKCLDLIYASVNQCIDDWKLDYKEPIGVFLSGGIDSALLLRYASAIVGPQNIRAYHLTWGEKKDESEYAQSVCDFCGVKMIKRFMPFEAVPDLMKESTRLMRAPSWCPQVLYMAQMVAEDGVKKAIIGLGLDALTGGEVNLVKAQYDAVRFAQEELFTLDLQRDFVWGNVYNCRELIDLKVPYLMYPSIVAFFRSLPIYHKVEGQITKLRIRKEIEQFKTLPPLNRDYGKIAGTKRGFGPNWEDYMEHGLSDFCLEHDPSLKNFKKLAMLPTYKNWKANPWAKMLHANLYFFIELLDEGAFTVDR